MRMNQRSADYWFIVVPTMTMLFAAPFAFGAVPAPFGPLPYYFAPFWVGLLTVPGYVMAWQTVRGQRALLNRERFFVFASLVMAQCCALAGALFAAFTVIGGVLALWSGVLTFILLGRLRTVLNPPPP